MRTLSAIVSTLAVSISLAAFSPSVSFAQQPLHLPEQSPAATATQTVGLTELKVSYHRPAVNGRKVFGDLIPYGEVWRAGANENTTVSFSSPVKIGGKPLPAGTYGLHMIPSAKEWTVIFSRMSVAWGSYGYDPKEDALRVQVAAQPGEGSEERLSYRFDSPTESAVSLTMRWERVKLAIPIEIDTAAVVMANIQDQLRGAAQFSWLAWGQAANYWLTHGGSLDEAQRMADKSIAMHEGYQNLTTRAAIAAKKGDAKLAGELRQKALALATEGDLNQEGYRLFSEKKYDEAIALFKKNVTDHPQSWNAYDSLAEAYQNKGDKKDAVENYTKALSFVKDEANRRRIEQTLVRLKGK